MPDLAGTHFANSRFLGAFVLIATTALTSACPPPPTAALETTPVGIVIGEVSIDDGGLTSVGGASVEMLGTSYVLNTEAGKQFVLPAVPVGEHTLQITHLASDRAARVPVTVNQAFQTVTLSAAQTTLGRAATVAGSVDMSLPGMNDITQAVAFLVGGNQQQLVNVGSDGEFRLASLPIGAAQIGVSAPGAAPVLVNVTLVEGENAISETFSLSATTEGLSITGAARLIDAVDHQAVIDVPVGSGRVIELVNASVQVDIDATSNYWGVTTANDIEDLILDLRPDTDNTDTIVGQTDYTGFSSTPLSLPNLP